MRGSKGGIFKLKLKKRRRKERLQVKRASRFKGMGGPKSPQGGPNRGKKVLRRRNRKGTKKFKARTRAAWGMNFSPWDKKENEVKIVKGGRTTAAGMK